MNQLMLCLVMVASALVVGGCSGDDEATSEPSAGPAVEPSVSVVGTEPVFPAPRNVVISGGSDRLRVSWDSVDEAERYELQYKRAPTREAQTRVVTEEPITEAFFTISNLARRGWYAVGVRAVKGNKTSEWSFQIGKISALGLPTNLRLIGGDPSKLTLSWDAVQGAATYDIQYRRLSDPDDAKIPTYKTFFSYKVYGHRQIEIFRATGRSQAITNLSDDGEYLFQVRAVDVLGRRNPVNEGPWSSAVRGSPYTLATPTNVVAIGGDEQLQVIWNAVEGATKYELRYKPRFVSVGSMDLDTTTAYTETNTTNLDAAEGSITIPRLTNDMAYNLNVRAVNNNEQKTDWSEEVLGEPMEHIGAPSIVLVNNTGNENDDAFTTDATIRVASREGATVALTMSVNDAEHTFSSGENEFTLDETGTTTINLATLVPSIAVSGNETNVIGLTATASQNSHTSESSPATNFTLVAPLALDAITMALEEDTGTSDDSITANPNITLSGSVPTGATTALEVSTNNSPHSHTVTLPGSASFTNTTNFGVELTEQGTLEVSITARWSRHGHTLASNLSYTLLNWPSTVHVDWFIWTDGIRFAEDLVIISVGDFLDAFDPENIKIPRVVITNTARETSSPLVFSEAAPMTEEYVVDLRSQMISLGGGDKIAALTFDYAGHSLEHDLDFEIEYQTIATYDRQFPISNKIAQIAITSNDVVLVPDNIDNKVYFYDTNGDPAVVDVGGDSANAATSFGGRGNGRFNKPAGIAVGAEGSVYVGDTANNRIQVFDDDFTFRTSLNINYPNNVFVVGGHFYVKHISGFWFVLKAFKEADLSEQTNPQTTYWSVDSDSDGVLHFFNPWAESLNAYSGNPTDGYTSLGHVIASENFPIGDDISIHEVLVDPRSDRIYLTDRAYTSFPRIIVLEYDGSRTENQYRVLGVIGKFPGTGNAQFNNPLGMVIHNNELYVVDSNNKRIQVFDLPESE